MNNNWLVLISTLHCMTLLVLRAEAISSTQYTKRNPKFDVKKDSLSSYQEPDFFALDTLAGIGLGKRSYNHQLIAVFQPSDINTNDHSFRFLGTSQQPGSKIDLPSRTFFNKNFEPIIDVQYNENRPSNGYESQNLITRMAGQPEQLPAGM